MEEKLVNILNEMAEYLSVAQMKKLQEVLLQQLTENSPASVDTSNEEFLSMFLNAKKIEGCSERTLKYYKRSANGTPVKTLRIKQNMCLTEAVKNAKM